MTEKDDYSPAKELADFLAEGEKPVYFGFASVFDCKDQDETVTIIVKALKQTGKRGIISGMGAIHNLPKNLLAINSIPHS